MPARLLVISVSSVGTTLNRLWNEWDSQGPSAHAHSIFLFKKKLMFTMALALQQQPSNACGYLDRVPTYSSPTSLYLGEKGECSKCSY